MTAESHYIHGSSAEEQRRLSLMNDLLNGPALSELRLSGGERILDLGSGTGQFTRAMAREAGVSGRVIGIERDDRQRSEAVRLARHAEEEGLVEFRSGDAMELALAADEWGSFDLVHTRFVLEHISDPQLMVGNMVKAARPAGKIVLADDDHANFRPWPKPDGFTPLWHAYIEAYVAAGNDPFIGRRLVDLLHQAGVDKIRNTSIFFGGCKGDDLFPAVADNLILVIEGAEEAMMNRGLISKTSFASGLAGLQAWREHPSATLWYYVCWVEGTKPIQT
jgi:SAM-dependent methyltransferase